MFEKVVTPSDVGKLNRLVIPKQHAEKYFPLDSSSNEKGLLLNFEDRSGKVWRFRYSYWNSSQSYVMTKGWSRFVKDKKLDAGDVVSFHRGVGELYRHRLYIDWRPRSHHHPQYYPSNSIFALPYFIPNHNNNYAINARSSLYSSNPPHPYPPPPYSHPHPPHHHFQQLPNYNNNNNYYTLHQHQQYPHPPPPPLPDHSYYLTSPIPQQQQEADRMIIDSVPIAHHHHPLVTAPPPAASVTSTTPGKRLRLFGVNMECASSPAASTATHDVPLPSSNPTGETSLHPSSYSQYPQ